MDTGVLEFWATRNMCVFDARVLEMYAGIYLGIKPHKVLSHHEHSQETKLPEGLH